MVKSMLEGPPKGGGSDTILDTLTPLLCLIFFPIVIFMLLVGMFFRVMLGDT